MLRREVASRTDELRAANERLRQLATQDSLTGAANRREFDELIEREVRRTNRSNTPLSLMMIDIDRFKQLNDLYGHPAGDQCLIRVVRAIRANASRAGEVVARYGGEEFAVILPNADEQAALLRAEAVRNAVIGLEIEHPGSTYNQRLTVSVGLATRWPNSSDSAEDLVCSADRALYQAKQDGRNRVVCGTRIAVTA
jgi:diguanylate cyclase (GGDEF)-like protein